MIICSRPKFQCWVLWIDFKSDTSRNVHCVACDEASQWLQQSQDGDAYTVSVIIGTVFVVLAPSLNVNGGDISMAFFNPASVSRSLIFDS